MRPIDPMYILINAMITLSVVIVYGVFMGVPNAVIVEVPIEQSAVELVLELQNDYDTCSASLSELEQRTSLEYAESLENEISELVKRPTRLTTWLYGLLGAILGAFGFGIADELVKKIKEKKEKGEEEMKKEKDGYYYEKIVTWKKKPDNDSICTGVIWLLLGVIVGVAVISSSNLSMNRGSTIFLSYLSCFMIIIGFIIWTNSLGEGRKIKFRRIGK